MSNTNISIRSRNTPRKINIQQWLISQRIMGNLPLSGIHFVISPNSKLLYDISVICHTHKCSYAPTQISVYIEFSGLHLPITSKFFIFDHHKPRKQRFLPLKHVNGILIGLFICVYNNTRT